MILPPDDNDDQAKASQILTSTFAAHPDLNGIFAANTISAEGVATGIRNARAVGKIKTVGFDAEPQSIQDLRHDVVQALIAQRPAAIGANGIDQAVNAPGTRRPTVGPPPPARWPPLTGRRTACGWRRARPRR